MKETLRDILERRSIRKFKPDPIPQDVLEQILEAGMYAATGRGAQSPRMVVVRDPETIKRMSRMNAEIWGKPDIDPFYGAPMLVLVLADRSRATYVEDGSLVLGNLMLAAHALGVGSCWIHRARQMFESEEGKAMLKAWGIEGDYAGIGHCILGYPDEQPRPPKPRRPDYVTYA